MGGAASSRNQPGNITLVAGGGGGDGGQESKENDENVIDPKLSTFSTPIKRNNTALSTAGYSVNNLPQAGGGPTQQPSLHTSPIIGVINGQISPHQTPSSGDVRSVPTTSSPLRHRSPLTAASGTSVASSVQGNEDVIAEGLAAFYGEDRGAQELESEMFSHTAMSLGMEQEDLLFNLLYFGGDGVIPDINVAMSNARDETIALHSENNTPYKLRPASNSAIEQLKCGPLRSLQDLIEPDCAVCKDDMEIGVDVIFLPTCRHCFHYECLVRWVKLQGFCPVCRAPICEQSTSSVSQHGNKLHGKISPRNVLSSNGSSASSSHGDGGMAIGMLSQYENEVDDDDDHERWTKTMDDRYDDEDSKTAMAIPKTGLASIYDEDLILSARSAAVSLTQTLLTHGSLRALQQSISTNDFAGGGAGPLGTYLGGNGNKNDVSLMAEEKNDRQIVNQSQLYSSSRHAAAHDKHMMSKEEDNNSDSKDTNDSKEDKEQSRENMMDEKALDHTGGEVKLSEAKRSDNDSEDDSMSEKGKNNDVMAAMLLSDSKHSDHDDDDDHDENYIPSGAKSIAQSKHHAS